MQDLTERARRGLAPAWARVVDHPIVVAIEDGTCPRPVVERWARQKFCQQREFSGNLAIVFSRMPLQDRELWSRLAGNLYGERDHTDIYLRFTSALGIDPDDMWAARPLPATAAFSDHIYRLVREGSMAAIAAAVHVGLEGVTVQHFPKLARGLRKHYGLDDDGVDFFTVHDEADTEHFEHGISVLAHYAGSDDEALDEALDEARRVIRLYELTYTGALTGDEEER